MKKLIKLSIIATSALPLLSLAQMAPAPSNVQQAPVWNFEQVLEVLNRFIGWFQAILFIVAIIFILIAAFYFITAKGDETKVSTARTMIVYAAVGIGVALLAFAIKPIVEQLLGF